MNNVLFLYNFIKGKINAKIQKELVHNLKVSPVNEVNVIIPSLYIYDDGKNNEIITEMCQNKMIYNKVFLFFLTHNINSFL